MVPSGVLRSDPSTFRQAHQSRHCRLIRGCTYDLGPVTPCRRRRKTPGTSRLPNCSCRKRDRPTTCRQPRTETGCKLLVHTATRTAVPPKHLRHPLTLLIDGAAPGLDDVTSRAKHTSQDRFLTHESVLVAYCSSHYRIPIDLVSRRLQLPSQFLTPTPSVIVRFI